VDLETLIKVLPGYEVRGETKGVNIRDVCYDSRRAREGSLFVAVTGLKADGHEFVRQAVTAGAVAVVVEREVDLPPGISQIRVADSRLAMGLLADAFYGHPSRKLELIGVTGTNGKTTTTLLLAYILRTAGIRTGTIGTLGASLGDGFCNTSLTTPEGPDLQRILRDMVDEGIRYAVMEVSSHAIDLQRIAACRFGMAILTNVTHDHLDYHASFRDYRDTKGRLFNEYLDATAREDGPGRAWAVINGDDKSASYFTGESPGRVLTYGLGSGHDIYATGVSLLPGGSRFDLVVPGGPALSIHTPLGGRFNVYNCLAAAAGAYALGVDSDTIRAALSSAPCVPGRFELVNEGQDFSVVVDYAHTPDGLENLLKAASVLKRSRLITVFGCGGDRDKTKRPLMGEVAARLSDHVIITSDNPRSEEPERICEDIVAGLQRTGWQRYETVVNRRQAIRRSIAMAETGDVVVIAGKGHETYQIFRERTVDFDDREEARQALRLRLKGALPC